MSADLYKKLYLSEDNFQQLDLSIFDDFKLTNLTSWSELQLYCDIAGINIDKNFIQFFICGACLSTDINNMLIRTIIATDLIDEFIDDDIILLLFIIGFVNFQYIITDDIIDKWYKIKNLSINISPFYMYFEHAQQLLKVIDQKFPKLLISFYNKNHIKLHRYSNNFIRFFMMCIKEKSKTSKAFKNYLNIIEERDMQQNQINKFLS